MVKRMIEIWNRNVDVKMFYYVLTKKGYFTESAGPVQLFLIFNIININ